MNKYDTEMFFPAQLKQELQFQDSLVSVFVTS